jgi:propionyl-CoA carboxylase alpha chain
MPSVGRLRRYQPPPEGGAASGSVRVDAGVTEGDEISVYFDPLIAKLVTHGPDRAAVTATMADALDRFVLDGIADNRSFLAAIMAHPRWKEGRLSTAFIAEEFPDGFAAAAPDPAIVTRLMIVALAIELRRNERFRTLPGRLNGEGAHWRADWVAVVGDRRLPMHADRAANGGVTISAESDAPALVKSEWSPGDPIWVGTVGDTPAIVQVRPAPDGLRLSSRGASVTVRILTPRTAALDELMPARKRADAGKQLRCPMPGVVVSVEVVAGQQVRAGEVVAVVEAMKMQNVLRAERDGTVKSVAARPGETLGVDAVIAEFE